MTYAIYIYILVLYVNCMYKERVYIDIYIYTNHNNSVQTVKNAILLTH